MVIKWWSFPFINETISYIFKGVIGHLKYTYKLITLQYVQLNHRNVLSMVLLETRDKLIILLLCITPYLIFFIWTFNSIYDYNSEVVKWIFDTSPYFITCLNDNSLSVQQKHEFLSGNFRWLLKVHGTPMHYFRINSLHSFKFLMYMDGKLTWLFWTIRCM